MYTENDLKEAFKKGIEIGVKCGKKGSTQFLLISIGIIIAIIFILIPIVQVVAKIPSEFVYKIVRDIFGTLCVIGAFFWFNMRNFLIDKAIEKEGVVNANCKETT